MDSNSVALASIALAATGMAGVVWVVKYFAKTLSVDLQEHTKAAINQTQSNRELTKASIEQRKASTEVLDFMKNLNGKLSRATIQTVQEQRVEHQTVEGKTEYKDNK